MSSLSSRPTDSLVRLLGVTSLGLGTTELVAPDAVARLAGVRSTPTTRRVLRALGAREVGHGAAVLAGSPRLVWTRTVGDVLDVALLVKGLAGAGSDRRRGALALAVLAVIGAADAYATADQLTD
jgi:hypothetical protein